MRIEQLRELGAKLTTFPSNFTLHRQVASVVQDREKMIAGQQPLDWGFAETLAYASLLTEGFEVRITGQDSGRGTFFHRHAVWHDQSRGETFIPLKNLSPSQPRFTVIDSLLSEEAVMGFEYGFSTTEPNCLTIWEAQFGDFANGAQVIIDQFISSGEAKWGRLCGLALHPAARLRRARTGALFRASRALPAVVRRAEHAGLRAVHACADVPHAAAADEAILPQAAHYHDAEESAASQTVGVAASRS